MLLAPGRVGPRTAVVCAVGVAAVLFAVPVTSNYIEQPALYGAQKRLFELGFFKEHLRSALVLAALPISLCGSLLLTRAKGVAAATVLIVAVMVAQVWTSQHAEITLEKRAAPRALPSPLDWVDRHASGPVALLAVGKDEPLRGSSDLYTDFFNRKVKYLFVSGASGAGACEVAFAPGRVLERRGGRCPAVWPREYVLLSGPKRVAVSGQKLLARSRGDVLVRVPPGAPRVR
jgi:hypothetical protein